MLDPSEFSDNVSINSDDTDILLTQTYSNYDHHLDDHSFYDDKFNVSLSNELESNNLNIFKTNNHHLFPSNIQASSCLDGSNPINNRYEQSAVFEKYNKMESQTSEKYNKKESQASKSPTRVVNKSPTRTKPVDNRSYDSLSKSIELSWENDSFTRYLDTKGYNYDKNLANKESTKLFSPNVISDTSKNLKKVSFEADVLDTSISMFEKDSSRRSNLSTGSTSSGSYLISESYDTIDAKVKEGQEILKRLLSGSDTASRTTSTVKKDSLLTNENNSSTSFSSHRTSSSSLSSNHTSIFIPKQEEESKLLTNPINNNNTSLSNISSDGTNSFVLNGPKSSKTLASLYIRSTNKVSVMPLENVDTNLDFSFSPVTENEFSLVPNSHVFKSFHCPVDLNHSTSTDMLLLDDGQPLHSLDTTIDESLVTDSKYEPCLESLNSHTKSYEESLNNHAYLMKIKTLQTEIENAKRNHLKEMNDLKDSQSSEVQSSRESITNLQDQKTNLQSHITQLKDSLTQKNNKCLEYQDIIHEKTKEIHNISIKDKQQQSQLQKEIDQLRNRERDLGRQVGDMEKALDMQLLQIKQLDERFKKEKGKNRDNLKLKDNEISILHEKLKQQSFSSQSTIDKLQEEYEDRLQSVSESISVDSSEKLSSLENIISNEKQERIKLQKQNSLQQDKYRINMESMEAANLKLKEQNEQLKKKLSEVVSKNTVPQHKRNEITSHSEETLQLKQALSQYEKLLKTVTLDLVEQNTKLCVITGKSSIKSITSPKKQSISKILSESLASLKDNLDGLRHFIGSLQQENQNLKNDSIDDNSSQVSPTSAKLLRHMQARMQQLRKENLQLRELMSGSSANQDNSEVLKLENKVHELEISMQNQESDSQKKNHLLRQRNNELTKLQKVLAQATKENLRLEKAHASLQSHSQEITPTSSSFDVSLHNKALGPDYPGTSVKKQFLDKKVISWMVHYPDYSPMEYTASKILEQPLWADPDISDGTCFKFNSIDGANDRRSYTGIYQVSNGRPRNPIGRTGMSGRGLLGKWGPNHAADPIVTRWLRNEQGEILHRNDQPILQFVAIQRRDCNEWAIPGGMVDAGEEISLTLKREFSEEALNSLEADQGAKEDIKRRVNDLFQQGKLEKGTSQDVNVKNQIYKGYVDDPRNTDNAWMETVAMNFHDDDGTSVGKLPLNSGDDAKAVRWLTIDQELNLYASHMDFIRRTCVLHSAYFA